MENVTERESRPEPWKGGFPDFWPIIHEGVSEEKLSKKAKDKIHLFEKGLTMNLSKDDNVEDAVEKIVKMALAAEFGPSLVKEKGAKAMVHTILQGIMGDAILRRQALLIVDRFAK